MNDPALRLAMTLTDFINTTYEPPAPVANNTELVRSEIVDSYGILDLIAFIETNFDVHVPDEDVRPDSFRTVDAMCAMIARLKGENDAA
jgi:acyl carrier protein